jgi:hypothetical protein
MTRDIRGNIRQVVTNDSARAIIATATGELIKTLGARRNQPDQRDPRLLASGLGGFAAGAGAATLASVTARRIGKLIGRRPFASVPKKAAAGTRKAVEVPREAVDRFASGLRDQIGGRGQSSGSTRASGKARRPASKTTTRRSSASGTRTRAKSTRSANGSSGRTKAKTTRSTNGSSGRPKAKATGSSNGSSGRSRTPARASASARR